MLILMGIINSQNCWWVKSLAGSAVNVSDMLIKMYCLLIHDITCGTPTRQDIKWRVMLNMQFTRSSYRFLHRLTGSHPVWPLLMQRSMKLVSLCDVITKKRTIIFIEIYIAKSNIGWHVHTVWLLPILNLFY